MSKLQAMTTWVQGYLDSQETGTVTATVKERIPGHYTLVYLGTRELDRQPDLQGNLLRHCSSEFQLYRYCINADTSWWDGLDQWMLREGICDSGPDMGQVEQICFFIEDVQCSQLFPDGLYEQTARIRVEYTTYHERQVSQ